MNTFAINRSLLAPMPILNEALARQRALTIWALVLLVAMVPTALALMFDTREIRGVNVWIKPLKFMISIALFSFSTAWFIGLLPEERRHTPAIRFVVTSILWVGVLEISYITWQSALGQASHYNLTDPLHIALYALMGVGACLLTATQGVLAVQISRYGRKDMDPAWRMAVVRGLWLTLVLGASVGLLLSGRPPPNGEGLPVFGWHAVADLRPAHFLGMHAQQFLPLLGLLMLGWPELRARRALNLGVGVYVLCWLGLSAMGLRAS
jgi:hypothetical protein